MVCAIKKIPWVVLSLSTLLGFAFLADVAADQSYPNYRSNGGKRTMTDSANSGESLNDLQTLSFRLGNMIDHLTMALRSEVSSGSSSISPGEKRGQKKPSESGLHTKEMDSGFNVEQEKEFLLRIKKSWNVHKGERHESIRE